MGDISPNIRANKPISLTQAGAFQAAKNMAISMSVMVRMVIKPTPPCRKILNMLLWF